MSLESPKSSALECPQIRDYTSSVICPGVSSFWIANRPLSFDPHFESSGHGRETPFRWSISLPSLTYTRVDHIWIDGAAQGVCRSNPKTFRATLWRPYTTSSELVATFVRPKKAINIEINHVKWSKFTCFIKRSSKFGAKTAIHFQMKRVGKRACVIGEETHASRCVAQIVCPPRPFRPSEGSGEKSRTVRPIGQGSGSPVLKIYTCRSLDTSNSHPGPGSFRERFLLRQC